LSFTAAVASSVCVLALLPHPAFATYPGRNGSIAFEYARVGDREHIWKMARDGTARKRIGPPTARWEPTWSPDGTRIAFWKPERGFDGVLRVMRANGRDVTSVRGFTDIGRELSWSPDGSRIALAAFSDFFRIHIVDVSSGTIVFRSRGVPHAHDSDPAFSPTGHRIAFVRVRGGGRSDIYTTDRNGRHVLRLTDDPMYESAPDWAPDASRLVFIADEEVAIVDRGGGPVIVLTNSTRQESNAVFSPNGRRILFDRCCFGPNDASVLFVMDVDGTGVTRLGRGSNPDWQPIMP